MELDINDANMAIDGSCYTIKRMEAKENVLECTNQALVEALEGAAKTMRNCRGAIESGQVVDKDVRGNLTRARDRIFEALEAAKQ